MGYELSLSAMGYGVTSDNRDLIWFMRIILGSRILEHAQKCEKWKKSVEPCEAIVQASVPNE